MSKIVFCLTTNYNIDAVGVKMAAAAMGGARCAILLVRFVGTDLVRSRYLSFCLNCSSSMSSSSQFPNFGTAAIHVGQEPEQWDMNQVVAPISLSTTYKQDAPGEPKASLDELLQLVLLQKHDYSRAGNPTRDVLEKCLAALEDAKHCSSLALVPYLEIQAECLAAAWRPA